MLDLEQIFLLVIIESFRIEVKYEIDFQKNLKK